MGQTISLEYDKVDLSEDVAQELGEFIKNLGERDTEDMKLRIEVESPHIMNYVLSLNETAVDDLEDAQVEAETESASESAPSPMVSSSPSSTDDEVDVDDPNRWTEDEDVEDDVEIVGEEDDVEELEEEADEDVEDESGDDEEDDLPVINPGTQKYATASILYHSDDRLTTREISELVEGTEYERGVSPISADLHQMYKDALVDRYNTPYKHELSEDGVTVLERTDAPIEPNPFADDWEGGSLEDEENDEEEEEEEETTEDEESDVEEDDAVDGSDVDEDQDDQAEGMATTGSPTDALVADQEGSE